MREEKRKKRKKQTESEKKGRNEQKRITKIKKRGNRIRIEQNSYKNTAMILDAGSPTLKPHLHVFMSFECCGDRPGQITTFSTSETANARDSNR